MATVQEMLDQGEQSPRLPPDNTRSSVIRVHRRCPKNGEEMVVWLEDGDRIIKYTFYIELLEDVDPATGEVKPGAPVRARIPTNHQGGRKTVAFSRQGDDIEAKFSNADPIYPDWKPLIAPGKNRIIRFHPPDVRWDVPAGKKWEQGRFVPVDAKSDGKSADAKTETKK